MFRFLKVDQLLRDLGEVGYGWDSLRSYVQEWSFPKRYPSPRAIRESLAKFSASEQLSLSPVLRMWVLEEVFPNLEGPVLAPKLKSALYLCDVVELLQASRSNSGSPTLLEAAVMRHLAAQQPRVLRHAYTLVSPHRCAWLYSQA